MSRTYRKGWMTLVGKIRDRAHHTYNDWFSKKNACRDSTDDPNSEYWGRDKRRVKQITRRKRRRKQKEIDIPSDPI